MIVNPQYFNYRLIIGSLIVAATVLMVYGFTSYKTLEAHQKFIEQEKKLVERELAVMISRYDDVSISNDLIFSQLEDAKENTNLVLDSVKMLRDDLSVLYKFKNQIHTLKSKNKTLFKTIDSVGEVTSKLEQQKRSSNNELVHQKLENLMLLEENATLEKSLEEGALLTANSFRARGYEGSFGTKRASNVAKRVKSIEVCLTIAENILTEAGEKEVYIQILDPKNNVIADKGAIKFENLSLIYSAKELVYYNNDVVELCLDVDADRDEQPLADGTYYISVFHKNRKLGSTQLNLK